MPFFFFLFPWVAEKKWAARGGGEGGEGDDGGLGNFFFSGEAQGGDVRGDVTRYSLVCQRQVLLAKVPTYLT